MPLTLACFISGCLIGAGTVANVATRHSLWLFNKPGRPRKTPRPMPNFVVQVAAKEENMDGRNFQEHNSKYCTVLSKKLLRPSIYLTIRTELLLVLFDRLPLRLSYTLSISICLSISLCLHLYLFLFLLLSLSSLSPNSQTIVGPKVRLLHGFWFDGRSKAL